MKNCILWLLIIGIGTVHIKGKNTKWKSLQSFLEKKIMIDDFVECVEIYIIYGAIEKPNLISGVIWIEIEVWRGNYHVL